MTGRLLRIQGLVQGVGFRPYVWRLASELGLRGWVRNDAAGVVVAIDGENVSIFVERLPIELPRLARIDAIEIESAEVPDAGFAILDSAAGEVRTAIGPDAALCPECIADLCNPQGRRWRYAFTTCTHCGPRYTVSRKIPYDRAHTSLAAFPLCAPCAGEYAYPADRRFHAETTCCPDCGPQLSLLDADGLPLDGDPIAATLQLLRAGRIVAIKGLGGFHLACDARNADAVAALRERKQREEKPFAVMGLNALSLAAYARIGDAEQALLASTAAPIVLCPKAAAELPGVAPKLAWLGAMLPATPVHLLLWHEAAGRPAGTAWLAEHSDLLLVMTSANPYGEPLVIGNDEALARLVGIADAYLVHNRDIVIRCDDSVVRAGPAFVRRARGYVPVPIPLADDGPTVLALGGYLKNTVCVLKGRQAFLSQHIGGLDNVAAMGFLDEVVGHMLDILEVKPALIAHDLHPDFPSSQLALRLAEELGVPALAIGHHQAHIAAICAEHGVNEPIFGLALDGVGLGPDGAAWGGELLHLAGGACQRIGHLQPLAMPGGDRAAKEPWRMAVAALHGAGLGYRVGAWIEQCWPQRDPGPLLTMLARNLRCPPTTSLGRWFDAAAGLLGVRDAMYFEGQAAMELEGLAAGHGPVEPLAGGYALRDNGRVLDLSPILPSLIECRDAAAYGASLFHATLAAGLAEWAIAVGQLRPGARLAVGGGCAMNAVLMAALRQHLAAAGLDLLEARQAPPNDGGLALGQAWVARRLATDG
ncbi:carbamoyltransferase HypF [Dechloromonas sp. XY25]|uniref:Carbamoyltransferase HypF n=1 Tax=Dechloromonas hankyongensis TaxID=2908002 RepID=A0ABS9JXG2_9RHOO|nr:carbamoyltransferase HypF [Dechloromonas hankyongensis]MCG2575583.1 carbamoyltransferase HypF [Dechloromonas hankyongensis]